MVADRWVNAIIEFTVPLDVDPNASAEEKGEAVDVYFENRFEDDLAGDEVVVVRHETVEAGEPVEVDPAVRLTRLRKGLSEEVERLRGSRRLQRLEDKKALADRLEHLLGEAG